MILPKHTIQLEVKSVSKYNRVNKHNNYAYALYRARPCILTGLNVAIIALSIGFVTDVVLPNYYRDICPVSEVYQLIIGTLSGGVFLSTFGICLKTIFTKGYWELINWFDSEEYARAFLDGRYSLKPILKHKPHNNITGDSKND